MKFLNTTLILAFLQPSFAADSLVPTKRNLRPPELKPAGDHKKEEAIKKDEKKTFMEPCIALVEDIQYEGGVSDEIMTCETSSGNIYDIDAPKGWMKDHIKKDHIMTGNMEIALDKVDGIVNNKVIFKNGAMPKLELKKNNRNDKRRKLAIVTGEKTVLVVRVVSNNGTGPSTSSNEESVSNKVFGNDIDPVNLASQYKACSHGKLNIIKAPDRTGKSTSISNGVVTVTVSTTTGEGDVAMRNAITNELNSEFDVSHPTELADHAMYCLPPETMGGIAYAFINSWMSVYSDEWCNSVSAQMHEIGHNLNMAHANENGVTYTDQSGMMGYSYSSDDGPIMCFNAAKSWQFGWYDDRHIVLSTSNPTYEGQLVGIADYSPSSAPVLVKLNTATSTDYYVNFNRKTGINSGTVEAGNQVTVVEQGGEGTGYAESSLKAKLGNGGIYTISNFDGSGQDATIVVNSINTNVNPGFANVSICIGPCTSPTPIPNITPSPMTLTPTLAPVTPAPVTPAPVTSAPITLPPITPSPVTLAPVPTTPSPVLVTATPVFPTSPGIDFSLETNPYCSSTGNAGGIWFDVLAKNEIAVTSFGFETTHASGTIVSVSVYTKAGTHVGFEQNPSAWTLLAEIPEVTVTTRRPGGAWPPVSTQLPEDLFYQPISVGERRAFYIHPSSSLTYGNNLDGGDSVGTLQVEDVNIKQFIGNTECGGGLFGCFNTIKKFNGFIHYTTDPISPTTPQPIAPVVPPTLQPVTSAPVPVSCTDMAVELELLTDNYGGETSWQLKENNSVVQSGSGYLSTTTYNIDLGCRTASEYNRFEFIINDSYGDGICCSYGTGSYKLKANGDIMKEGGEFTTSESFSFPVDPNPPTPAPVPVGSTKPFKLELRTDYWGYETSWLLTASDGSEYSGSNYNNNLLYTVEHLLPGNGCHTFTMNDSYGDGIYFGWYKLYWDGVVVHNVIGNFGLQEISTFGTGCVLSTELHSNGPIKVREPPNDAGATVKPPV